MRFVLIVAVAATACAERSLTGLEPPDDLPSTPACVDDGTWIAGVVDDVPHVGPGPRLDRTPDGTLHIVSRDLDSGDLRYSSNREGPFSTTVIPLGVASADFDFAIDAGGRMHVITTSTAGIDHVVVDGGIVDRTTIVQGAANHPTVSIDPRGALHVVYSDWNESGGGFGVPSGGIRYATNADGTWRETEIAALPGPASLATADDNSVRIVNALGKMTLVVIEEDGTRTDLELDVESSVMPRLAIAPNGDTHVVFANDVGHFVHGRSASGAWTNDVAPPFSYPVQSVAVAVDADGTAHLGAVTESGALLFAIEGDTFEPRWPQRQVSGDIALTVGGDGDVTIAYQAWNERRVMIAHRGSCLDLEPAALEPLPSWSNEIVDAGRDAAPRARDAEIAAQVDRADGSLHVAFAFRDGNCCPGLFYSTNRSGAWRTQMVADAGSPYGLMPAIAVVGDRVHVTYRARDGLRYATRSAQQDWVVDMVAEAPGLYDSALVVDDDSVSVIYGGVQVLVRAWPTAEGFRSEIIDPGTDGHIFKGVSAAVGPDGAMHVGYADHYGEIRYANNATGSWTHERVANRSGETAIRVADGQVRMMYVAHGWVRTVIRDESGWHPQLVDVVQSPGTVAIGAATDGPIAAAYDGWPSGGVTFLAVHSDGGWRRELVGIGGAGATVATDDDSLAVFYFDRTTRSVRVARRPRTP